MGGEWSTAAWVRCAETGPSGSCRCMRASSTCRCSLPVDARVGRCLVPLARSVGGLVAWCTRQHRPGRLRGVPRGHRPCCAARPSLLFAASFHQQAPAVGWSYARPVDRRVPPCWASRVVWLGLVWCYGTLLWYHATYDQPTSGTRVAWCTSWVSCNECKVAAMPATHLLDPLGHVLCCLGA